MTQHPEGGCGGHTALGEELRAVATALLDRVEPVLDRVRSGPGRAEPTDVPASCAVCPVCALIAVLRGDRPELAVRMAEHVAALVAVLRAALDEGGPLPETAQAGAAAQGGTGRVRRVQHIDVERPARSEGQGGC